MELSASAKPTEEQTIQKHRILHSALLTLIIFTIFSIGIIIGYVLNKNSNTIANLPKVSNGNSVIVSNTPTPSRTQFKANTKENLKFSYLYDGNTTDKGTYSIEIPERAFLRKTTVCANIDPCAPYDTEIYEVKGDDFQFRIFIPYDPKPSSYENVIDIKNTLAFKDIFRVKLFNSDTHYYMSEVEFNEKCTDPSGEQTLAPPCGVNVITDSLISQNEKYIFEVSCETKTKDGLNKCDSIVKTMKKI